MTTLLTLVFVSFAIEGALMVYLGWAFESERYRSGRFQEPLKLRATPAEQRVQYAKNIVLSTGMVFASIWLGMGTMYVDAPTPWWWVAVHGFAILAVYDLAYYAMHRFLFHHKKLMRFVHRTHHEARYPRAQDALWIHPLETVAGIGLLLAVVWLLGPVNVWTFGLMFTVYSVMNIVNHMGMAFPTGHPLSPFNRLALVHYGHHKVDIHKNFATLTTVWDRLFGTAVVPEVR